MLVCGSPLFLPWAIVTDDVIGVIQPITQIQILTENNATAQTVTVCPDNLNTSYMSF